MPFYKGEKVLKLNAFTQAKKKIERTELDLLELWESILTGRVAPVSKILKDRYRILGLNHIFTPSGFHLSAVLGPILKLVKSSNAQLTMLFLVALGIYGLPGMSALKRMVTIKIGQKILGLHLGFFLALGLDIFFGTFNDNTLSFTYSFLFLGIIYSGLNGFPLIIWFFLAQTFLSYFQETSISLLLLVFSPLLNFIFTLLMPLLFLLAIPLWDWQLRCGITVLKAFQFLVDYFAALSIKVPAIEVHVFTLFLAILLLFSMPRLFLLGIFFFCNSLNVDHSRAPGMSVKEYLPSGKKIKIIEGEDRLDIKFEDGKCRMKLVRGFWWENCSPRRRSNKMTS